MGSTPSRVHAPRRRAAKLLLILALAALGTLTSCGYHVGGKADLLPDTVRTIAVPAFGNSTVRYKLTDWMPQAISKEFLTRTRYRIVSDPSKADAVLNGNILRYNFFPIIYDDKTGRANVAQLYVTMDVRLTDTATGEILYQQPAFQVDERYQISPNPVEYFEESDYALQRASQQVAQQIVTAVLENF